MPDPGQIPQVEGVMELGRSWKHLDFGQLPETAGQTHELGHHALNLLGKTTVRAEVALTNHTCVEGVQLQAWQWLIDIVFSISAVDFTQD